MFYQSIKSNIHNFFEIQQGADFKYPLHLHQNFELIWLTDGEMNVTIDQTEYLLNKGAAVLVFPYQPHAITTVSHSRHRLCIFSTQLVNEYQNVFLNKSPKINLFYPDQNLLSALFSCGEKSSGLRLRGLLYTLLAEFDENAEYTRRKTKDLDLLMKIFEFVDINYKEDCSLGTLAEHLSYHEVYLSHYFKKCTGIAFTDYLNQCRISEGAYILRNTQKQIVDIAFECGFDSLRSFNRNFKAITGMTPNQYRSKDKAPYQISDKSKLKAHTMTLEERHALVEPYLGKTVTIEIDHVIDYEHQKNAQQSSPINYGYIPNVASGSSNELVVYLLGTDRPIHSYTGSIIGIVYRADGDEDRLVMAYEGTSFTATEIAEAVRFKEQYYRSTVHALDGSVAEVAQRV